MTAQSSLTAVRAHGFVRAPHTWITGALTILMAVTPSRTQAQQTDPFLWLEDVESPRALETSFQRILSDMEKTRLEAGPVVRQPIDLSPLLLVPPLAAPAASTPPRRSVRCVISPQESARICR